MPIDNLLFDKIFTMNEHIQKRNELEREIYAILESENIDIHSMKFIDTIGSKLSYGLYETKEMILSDLEKYISGNWDALEESW